MRIKEPGTGCRSSDRSVIAKGPESRQRNSMLPKMLWMNVTAAVERATAAVLRDVPPVLVAGAQVKSV